MKKQNVVILSMQRCGMSWVGGVISLIHERLYGEPLHIIYEDNRAEVSNRLVEGWNGVYNIDPTILLKLGYDKILIIKRELDTLKEVHAHYHGYQEIYKSLEDMKDKRSCFFEKIELYYDLLYNQSEIINNSKILMVNLENLNNYTYSTFNEIIEFLDFKLSFKQKIKFFLRVLKNKVFPFVIPINSNERNWDIYSSLLPKNQELCERLKYLEDKNIRT